MSLWLGLFLQSKHKLIWIHSSVKLQATPTWTLGLSVPHFLLHLWGCFSRLWSHCCGLLTASLKLGKGHWAQRRQRTYQSSPSRSGGGTVTRTQTSHYQALWRPIHWWHRAWHMTATPGLPLLLTHWRLWVQTLSCGNPGWFIPPGEWIPSPLAGNSGWHTVGH